PEKVDLYPPDPDHEGQRCQGLQIPTGVISQTLHPVIDVVRRVLPRVHVIVRIELGELDPVSTRGWGARADGPGARVINPRLPRRRSGTPASCLRVRACPCA